MFCCWCIFLCLCPVRNYANSDYREVDSSAGKILLGLTKESALEKFGVPAQASGNLWLYSAPEKFFVLFPRHSLLNIYLYPQHSSVPAGSPLEFKAFGYFSDAGIKDITNEVQLLISEPNDFILDRVGVIIPKKNGEYQILAKYENIFSNPANLLVKETQQKESTEKLISINILPFKPIIPYQGQLQFIALGTFLDSLGKYSIKDIGEEATWYVKQDKEITENQYKGNIMFYQFSGSQAVFCRYNNLQSFPQEVYVQDKPVVLNDTLKHITLLPEVMSVSSGGIINLRAFGTYYTNRVEDITRKVKWEIGDKDMLVSEGPGVFLTGSVGITEVTAVLDDSKSLATKIIIRDKGAKNVFFAPGEEKRINPQNLTKDIKKEVEKLRQILTKEEKKLNLIRISPDNLEIPAGETREASALGIYSDHSKEDLTHIGDWSSSNDKIAKASGGKIDAIYNGEAKIYVTFKGVKSEPASVKVVGPKLVSIILSPQNLQISMKDNPELKAEGYFSDSSRKDITSMVSWEITNPRIIKIKDGKIIPLKFGGTEVYAEYLGIKSLPANIMVLLTSDWLLSMIIKVILFLLLSIFGVFTVLYVLTEKEKNKLKNSLNKDPAEFIINLYENTKRILAIFYLSYQDSILPLSYAELVQKNYSIGNNLFLRFTAKFEEARYSRHSFSKHDASLALNDYNDFLKAVFIRYNKLSLFLKYCLTLLHITPLFISIP